MDDKSQLLHQLKIDRTVEAPGSHAGLWLGLALLVLFLSGLLVWLTLFKAVEVDVALAHLESHSASQGSTNAGNAVLDASGYITARRYATVSSKVTAKVEEILVEEGMTVEEGQLLAKLDNVSTRARLKLARSQLLAAKTALLETEAQLQLAQRQLERNRELLAQKLISVADFDGAESTYLALQGRLQSQQSQVQVAADSIAIEQQFFEDTFIRAPFAGVVISKDAQPGEMISPVSAGGGFTRTGICTIVDMDSLEVQVDVNERYINRVQPGQDATANLNAYPDWQIPSRVLAIIPAADRQKATVQVRLELLTKDGRILPDMGVKVSFLEQASETTGQDAASPAQTRVSIPAAALFKHEGYDSIFLLRDGQLERRSVIVFKRQGEQVILSGGLQGGEQVVISDQTDLEPGERASAKQ